MCRSQIPVTNVPNQREAYEIEQFLLGLPHVDDVDVDRFEDTVLVEYDEHEITYNDVLDYLEHSGCTPQERKSRLRSLLFS